MTEALPISENFSEQPPEQLALVIDINSGEQLETAPKTLPVPETIEYYQTLLEEINRAFDQDQICLPEKVEHIRDMHAEVSEVFAAKLQEINEAFNSSKITYEEARELRYDNTTWLHLCRKLNATPSRRRV